MKNWAMIAIFPAAMVLSVAAQQPLKSRPANSGQPTSIASAASVSAKDHREVPQADLKKTAAELNDQQRGEIEQYNLQLKQRFAGLQEAGGWQSVFATQLKLQRLANPKAPQLNAAQQFITDFIFCDHPLIAGNISEFQRFTSSLRPHPVSKQFSVEPLASIIINGCSFGQETGEVRLILNRQTGSFVSLQVSDWSNSSIFATLGADPGISDQEAQLVVVRKDRTQSAPMPVQFFQHRMSHVASFDTAAERPARTF